MACVARTSETCRCLNRPGAQPSQPTTDHLAFRHHTIQVRAQGALLHIHLAKYEEHVKINVYIIYITQ